MVREIVIVVLVILIILIPYISAEDLDCIPDVDFGICVDSWGIDCSNIRNAASDLCALVAPGPSGISDAMVNAFVNRTGDTMTGDLNTTNNIKVESSGFVNITAVGNIIASGFIQANSFFGELAWGNLTGIPAFILGNYTNNSIYFAGHQPSYYLNTSEATFNVNSSVYSNYSTYAANILGEGNLNVNGSTYAFGHIFSYFWDFFVNITGDVMTGDLNISTGNTYVNISASTGTINISGNITMTNGWFRQNSYVMRPVASNDKITGDLFSLSFSDGTGFIPHIVVQPGAPGQASVFARSLILANDNHSILNTSNVTSCLNWAESEDFELKVDCNSTAADNPMGTGADLIVMGDVQVKGEIWLRDTDLEWHDFSDELRFIDAITKNTVLTGINGSLSGGIFTISELDGKNISVNINETQNVLNRTTDSITLTSGTNATPILNQLFYRDQTDPRLQIGITLSTTIPSVASILMGNNFVYASATGAATGERFIGDVFTRFFNQGPLYVSGFNTNVISTEINISTGTMMILTTNLQITSNHSTTDLSFEIHNDGSFHQHTHNISGFDSYSTGEAIGNNKYFNVVCGIVATHDNTGRMFCVVQNIPSSEHTKALDAELDQNFLVFFPTNDFVKKLYVPVVRVVVKRASGVNTIQTLSSGLLFTDIRGQVVGTGGAAPTPVTDVWVDETGDTMSGDLNVSTGAGFVNISSRGFINVSNGMFVGSNLSVDTITSTNLTIIGGFVGIGTTQPRRQLHIFFHSPEILLEQSTTAATSIGRVWRHSVFNGKYFFQAFSSDLTSGVSMLIVSNRSVGIKKFNPTATLDVDGDGMFQGNLSVYKGTGYVNITAATGNLVVRNNITAEVGDININAGWLYIDEGPAGGRIFLGTKTAEKGVIMAGGYIRILTGGGDHFYMDAGGNFLWRDIDAANAVRMTLASGTGFLTLTGGATIGDAADDEFTVTDNDPEFTNLQKGSAFNYVCYDTTSDEISYETSCGATPVLYDWNMTYLREIVHGLEEVLGTSKVVLETYNKTSNFTFTIKNEYEEVHLYDRIWLESMCFNTTTKIMNITLTLKPKRISDRVAGIKLEDGYYSYLKQNQSISFWFNVTNKDFGQCDKYVAALGITGMYVKIEDMI